MISELELNKLLEKIDTDEYIPIGLLSLPINNDEAWGSALSLFFGIGVIGFIAFILSIIFVPSLAKTTLNLSFILSK